MSIVEQDELTNTTAGSGGANRDWRGYGRNAMLLGLVVVLILLAASSDQLGRLGRTALVITLVVGASAAVFVLSNLLISTAKRSWSLYRGIAGGLLGAAGFGLLRGNRSVGGLVADSEYQLIGENGVPFSVDDPDLISILSGVADPDLVEFTSGALGLLEWPLVGAVLGAFAGYASGLEQRALRVALPIITGLGAGWLIAGNLLFRNRPDANVLTILAASAIGAVAGALLTMVLGRGRALVERALAGAVIGAVIAGWLMPDLATGSLWDARFATMIPLGLLGARVGWPGPRGAGAMADFDRRSRAFIFLFPALATLGINLVIPALRTMYTSFLDRESERFVALDNYEELVGSSNFIDFSAMTDPDGSLALLSNRLFWVGLVLVLGSLAVSASIHYTRNRATGLQHTPGSVVGVASGIILLAFALFSLIRGTFPNTLWWMVTVTVGSTAFGLAMAVLSARAGRFENLAKSLVFAPMAISMVGASIIWRFQYQPKNVRQNQTGVLNALWVELGKLSQAGVDGAPWSALPRIIVLVVLGVIAARLAFKIYQAYQADQNFVGSTFLLAVVGYLFVELMRRSLGGFAIDPETGAYLGAEAVAFREEVRPFNNLYLMFIMIWIQTGFAMVILSAAIKAVPEEFLEAARIDGASESDQFFYVVLPQILPTLGVVVTTILVAVVKVFDIVKVSTGGNFGTNVLANDFFTEAFQNLDRGLGSAIAMFILLTVAPILIFNVYQMQKAES